MAADLTIAARCSGTTAVNNGEVLGTGTFQSLSVSGATSVVRPGGTGTTGTITVTGDYVQSNRATLAVDITAAGAADRLTIGGAASLQTNAALAITKAAGTYVPGTRFTLLTAGGGLTGTFGSVTADSDPLTLLRVNYSTNAVTLDVLRSAAGFTTAATTPNQLAVATAIGMLDINNPLYTAVGSIVSNTTLAGTLDALSGEVHASAASWHGARCAADGVLGRLADRSRPRRLGGVAAGDRRVGLGQRGERCGGHEARHLRRDGRRRRVHRRSYARRPCPRLCAR